MPMFHWQKLRFLPNSITRATLHSFKTYVGVRPENYKWNSKILQDWQPPLKLSLASEIVKFSQILFKMIKINFTAIIVAVLAVLGSCNEKKKRAIEDVSQIVSKSYFGQNPPGMTPEIFAPGTISVEGRYEHGISFSPDLNEVYFSANKDGGFTSIYYSKFEGNE